MKHRLKHTIAVSIDFLARPFTRMSAFTVSMLVVYVLQKYLLHAQGIQLKYVVPELYTWALLLSVLKGKWRTAGEWVVIVVAGCVSVVEAFLMNRFHIELSCQAIQLLMETNGDEATQFLHSFVFTGGALKYFGVWAVGLAAAGGIYLIRAKGLLRPWLAKAESHPKGLFVAKVALIVAVAGFYFVRTGWLSMQPRLVYTLLGDSVGEFETRFIAAEEAGGGGACTPMSRLVHGARLYHLTTKQCHELIAVAQHTRIDGCNHRAQNLILIVGESFIKRHAQIYGYDLPTTPRMLEQKNSGNLVAVDDAITMLARTSDVFKEMLSMHSVDQPGSWSSQPIFLQLFRQAGYRVSMISNQYTRFSSDIWNSTGAFFLTNPEVSKWLVDYQNEQKYRFDEGLLAEVDAQMRQNADHRFILLHMRGQHVSFNYGYPENRRYFTAKDYARRRELTREQKETVADYDNCTRYQDSIAGALFDRYANTDMVIVMVSDHGENVYDDGKTLGRVHNEYSRELIESQYQIPMWIWCSPKYQALHPDMMERIRRAASQPFEIDDIPHLMLDLAGIKCKYFNPTRSPINPSFNPHRKRLIGDQKADYRKLMGK